MSGEIPREIAGQTPRKPDCLLGLKRAHLAAVEAREKIVDYVVNGGKESLALAQEPPTVEGEIFQPAPAPIHRKKAPRSVDVLRSVEKHNINNALNNPNGIRRVTESLVNFLVDNGERVIKFAKTLRHKGKLHPAVARELGMETRKGAKTSILEQAS